VWKFAFCDHDCSLRYRPLTQAVLTAGTRQSISPLFHRQQPVRETSGMSQTVEPHDLQSVAAEYGNTPFLLYSSGDGSARVNHVVVSVESAPPVVRVEGFGRGVARRVEEGAALSLLWPAPDAETFSLIADGSGSIDDDGAVLSIAISGAVLHRPAPLDGASSC
jgi:hypothetical protein